MSSSPASSARSRRRPPQDVRLLVGQRIKALRAQRLVTQEDLAARIGTYSTYLSRVESGQANPTLTMLQALAQALDVPITELFVPVEAPPARRVQPLKPAPSRGRTR